MVLQPLEFPSKSRCHSNCSFWLKGTSRLHPGSGARTHGPSTDVAEDCVSFSVVAVKDALCCSRGRTVDGADPIGVGNLCVGYV